MNDEALELLDDTPAQAREFLKWWTGVRCTYPRGELPVAVYDLAHAGLMEVEPTSDHAGNAEELCTLTFAGMRAQLHLASGAYDAHQKRREMKERIAAAESGMASIPGWGSFA